MSQFYSNPSRENDPHALPDCEVFERTAEEVAESSAYEDEQFEALKRFPLASMKSLERAKLIDYLIEEHSITGGWFYQFCFPGCLPDSEPIGPFKSRDEAIAAAQDEND